MQVRLLFDGGRATETDMKNVLLLIHDGAGEEARFQAYGHSRLRERLIGGGTRLMLAESPVPFLLGH